MSMRTKQNPPRRLSRLISEQDLRNIGLSKYYVENIVKRISEYKRKNGATKRYKEEVK